MRWAVVVGALGLGCASSASDRGPGPTSLGDDATGTTGVTSDATSASGGPQSCIPGMQIACACPGGIQGSQACDEDGEGYLPCECPAADTGGADGSGEVSGGSSTTRDDTDSTGAPSCDPQWKCGTCNACGQECTDCDGCVSCAAAGDCSEQYAACMADAECSAAMDCTMACGLTLECSMKCAPAGEPAASLYSDTTTCIGNRCLSLCV